MVNRKLFRPSLRDGKESVLSRVPRKSLRSP